MPRQTICEIMDDQTYTYSSAPGHETEMAHHTAQTWAPYWAASMTVGLDVGTVQGYNGGLVHVRYYRHADGGLTMVDSHYIQRPPFVAHIVGTRLPNYDRTFPRRS